VCVCVCVCVFVWASEFRWMILWVSERVYKVSGWPTEWKSEWRCSKLSGWFTSLVEGWCSSTYVLTRTQNMSITRLIGTLNFMKQHIVSGALWKLGIYYFLRDNWLSNYCTSRRLVFALVYLSHHRFKYHLNKTKYSSQKNLQTPEEIISSSFEYVQNIKYKCF
jgi:hypothetical protein